MTVKRDGNGQWAKGQTGNPKGRPRKEHERTYYSIFCGVVTPERFKVVVEKMIEQAERGNGYARKQMFEYLLGIPSQYFELKQTGAMKLVIEHVRFESPDTGAASGTG